MHVEKGTVSECHYFTNKIVLYSQCCMVLQNVFLVELIYILFFLKQNKNTSKILLVSMLGLNLFCSIIQVKRYVYLVHFLRRSLFVSHPPIFACCVVNLCFLPSYLLFSILGKWVVSLVLTLTYAFSAPSSRTCALCFVSR